MIDHGREIFHNKASSMLTVVDVLILAKIIVTFVLSITPRGGNPGNSWSGCAARFFKPWPDFRHKKCNFQHPRVFRPGLAEIMLSLLRLDRKQKNYSNPFRIRIFLFPSYSFGIETINTFIHAVVPSKTIPASRPKCRAKCINTRFQTKTAQKPYPMGRHILVWLIIYRFSQG